MHRREMLGELLSFQILFIVLGVLAIFLALYFEFEPVLRVLAGIVGVLVIIICILGIIKLKKVKYG